MSNHKKYWEKSHESPFFELFALRQSWWVNKMSHILSLTMNPHVYVRSDAELFIIIEWNRFEILIHRFNFILPIRMATDKSNFSQNNLVSRIIKRKMVICLTHHQLPKTIYLGVNGKRCLSLPFQQYFQTGITLDHHRHFFNLQCGWKVWIGSIA